MPPGGSGRGIPSPRPMATHHWHSHEGTGAHHRVAQLPPPPHWTAPRSSPAPPAALGPHPPVRQQEHPRDNSSPH
eukprot:3030156-Prorocentrum_lima.AAC.1